jgi:hypothetical protein
MSVVVVVPCSPWNDLFLHLTLSLSLSVALHKRLNEGVWWQMTGNKWWYRMPRDCCCAIP